MILLQDGCKCGKLTVTPKDWNETGASLDCTWMISYRFYEPGQKPYQVIIKGMNELKTLEDRRKSVKELLRNENDYLKNYGWNPRLKTFKVPPPDLGFGDQEPEVLPTTNYWEALQFAYEHLEVSDKYRETIKSHLSTFEQAGSKLRIFNFALSDIKKKDVRNLLNSGKDIRGEKWTANNFNSHRSSLRMLYEVLKDHDAVEYNVVTEIKKKVTVQKLRKQLTHEERVAVSRLLDEKYKNFRRFVLIFFHSGARISELLRLKVKDVDLKQQRYNLVIMKSKQPKEVYKVIKNIALPLWEELIEGANPEHYVFSEALRPGNKSIRPEQVTRRWKRHVKDNKELNIKADLYSLKHSNSREVARLLSLEDAAALNDHEGTGMVRKIYAADEAIRQENEQMERLKALANRF